MQTLEFESKLNHWGHERVPFLFLVDFELENLFAWKIDEVPDDILFSVGKLANIGSSENSRKVSLTTYEMGPQKYKARFAFVKERIERGDSYLVNLTIKTEIDLNYRLDELIKFCEAKYKFCWKDKFLVFSPETFIQIKDKRIYSYPMKGTIDAAIDDAEEAILTDAKELSEHITIVDLIRNDLSRVADNVEVNRFRYLGSIKTNQKDLLQVSSEISGTLPEGYTSKIGSILVSLLPAGSISGAPKNRTVQIIREAEKEKRGFYTGVFGYFDGTDLDSAVLIRFIEQQGDKFYYRSGGGITAQSDVDKEYQEAIDKIYVPVH
jgi:para-aminobenzoate synthetase component I